jgi:pyruvate/2-oxoglutarate dehydrogenase complex dihydrolipoamide acyltransferase (E2) component
MCPVNAAPGQRPIEGADSVRHVVNLPKLGDTADDVVVLEWLVTEGDVVAEGDALLSVETNKIDAEVPSPVSGTLVERLVTIDDEVATGAAIAVVET